jgi:hypothetical protein
VDRPPGRGQRPAAGPDGHGRRHDRPRTRDHLRGHPRRPFGGGVGGVANASVVAQEEPALEDRFVELRAERAEAYQGFVASLATHLAIAVSDVDAAIRDALKQRTVDEFASGELTEEEAAASSR